MEAITAYLREHHDRFDRELFDLLRIQSVSTDSSFSAEVARGADWLARHFQEIGLSSEVISTEGHPLVYAESPPVAGRPVVLVYGHYDVQPPDPLDEWDTPPFEPTLRSGNIYARGATDDKGQMFTHIKGAEAWLKTAGELPVQVKFLIEGEEEVGSANLEKWIPANCERLACDSIVISDTSQFAAGVPAITYGLRGIAYYELRLSGPKQDLHSGTFGGAVRNPAIVLAKMLAALTDDPSRIAVPGFYDDVAPLSDQERKQLAELPFDEAAFARQLGVYQGGGEEGYSTLERRWARPSFDVNGLTAGYQKQGAKTVLPAIASAKFSFRLVPNQDPKKITASLQDYLESLLPGGIRMELIDMHGSPATVVPLESPYVEASKRAIAEAFGREPVMIREGGSIPIVETFSSTLGADTLLLGWGLPDDNTHSPNEKLNHADYHRAIHASAALWRELAEVST